MGRQDAHEAVRVASMEALRRKEDLAAALSRNREVAKFLSRKELSALLRPEKYIGTAPEQVDQVIAALSPYLDGNGRVPKRIRRKK
jgi:adenylosuccinate lyase